MASNPAASITTSAPSPSVASITACAGSSPVTISASCAAASRSRSATRIVARTRPAPYRNAAFTMSKPIGPAPLAGRHTVAALDGPGRDMHRVGQRLRERGHLVRETSAELDGGGGGNGEPLGEASRHVAPHQPSGRAMVDRSFPAPAAGAAGHDRLEHHPLAEPRGGNSLSDLGDLADRLVTHDERRDAPRARLAEPVQVRPADRRCPRRDHDLAGSRPRIRGVLELHPARPEVHERLHG